MEQESDLKIINKIINEIKNKSKIKNNKIELNLEDFNTLIETIKICKENEKKLKEILVLINHVKK